MSDRRWQGDGPQFLLNWGGETWILDLDRANPGLRPIADGSSTRLLCVDTLAQAGRSDADAFNSKTLVGFERHLGRIEAIFAPDGWGGSIVRAAWSPTLGADGVDLEIQITATSVGELKGVEVAVSSDFPKLAGDQPAAIGKSVEARDAPSAAFSYDGRESSQVLRTLSTLPLPSSSPSTPSPWIYAPPGPDPELHYIEMVQPNDASRRIVGWPMVEGASDRTAASIRHALFGHDLEKGVILRARMRGLWIRSKSPKGDAILLMEEFLREPLPLGP